MNKKIWYIFFILISTLLIVITYYLMPENANFLLSNFYLLLANSFLSLPHEPVIILLGKKYNPYFVTLVALIPTFLACIIDYDIINLLVQKTRLKKIRHNSNYKWLEKKFSKAPFLTNFLVSATPLPFSIIRFLSILSGYSRWKYAFSVLLGRIPRYFLLAYFGKIVQIPDWILIALFLLFLLFPFLQKYRGRKVAEETPSEVLLNEIEHKIQDIQIDTR